MRNVDMKSVLCNIASKWFLKNPLMYEFYCRHDLIENDEIPIPFRCGNSRIEYNPEVLKRQDIESVEKYFEREIYRIMLGHPYSRKPADCDDSAAFLASNLTITQEKVAEYGFPPNQSFEFYYSQIAKSKNCSNENDMAGGSFFAEKTLKSKTNLKSSDGSENGMKEDDLGINDTQKKNSGLQATNENENEVLSDNFDADKMENAICKQTEFITSETKGKMANNFDTEESGSALWQENELKAFEIKEMLLNSSDEEINRLPNNIAANIKKMIEIKEKKFPAYVRLFRQFKKNAFIQSRSLTRMKPNRRTGFLQMGSGNKYVPYPRILVAIDTSGSVIDEQLQDFYGIISYIFKEGTSAIHLVQFDTKIKGKPLPFKKRKSVEIYGRGGTDFQAPVSYFCAHKEYDGYMIFTDGFAAKPIFTRDINKKHLIWVLTNPLGVQDWMRKCGAVAFVDKEVKYKYSFGAE